MERNRREKRQYTEEFKTQVVNLYNNGKKRCELNNKIMDYSHSVIAFFSSLV